MELSDLKLFICTAEEASITRAAAVLGYVQSNLTARIRKLEAELGTALFHRLARGVMLTEKGQDFLEYAKTIVNLSDEAVRVVQDTDFPSGSLTIGVAETVTCGNFISVLSEFQTQYPDVTVSIKTGVPDELMRLLKNHKLDGAFIIGDYDVSHFEQEYELELELIMLGGQALGQEPPLDKMRWAVSPSGCPFRSVLEKWLAASGLELTNVIEISSLETLLSCVRSGLAYTILPSYVKKGEYASLHTCPIPEAYRKSSASFIRNKNVYTTKAFQAFSEVIRHRGL